MSGALLYVYINESTTDLATIYTDEALSTPSPNPVVANTSGQFPSIWAEAGTEADPTLYRVAVTTSDGGSPGNAFVFDNYRPSVDFDTATAALAEAAAASAEADRIAVEAAIDTALEVGGGDAALAGALAGATAGATAGQASGASAGASAGATAGASAGTTAGAAAGTTAGSTAGTAAATAVLIGKADTGLGNVTNADMARRSNKAAPFNNRVALLGDSITAQGIDNTTLVGQIGIRNVNRGMTHWLPFLTDQRFVSPQGLNFGVIGQTSGQIAARVGDVIASGAGTCVVLAGTNDIGTNNFVQTTANLASIYQALANANVLIIALPILNRTLASEPDYSFVNHVNRWIINQASNYPNFKVVDPFRFGDPYSLTLSPKTGFTYDGLHPTAIGMFNVVRGIGEYLNTVLPPLPRVVRDVTDFYTATNPTGYKNANPMMAGTSGTAGSGVTGSVANNWAVSVGAGGGDVSGLTVTCSKDTDSTNLECQKIVVAGTATGGFQTVVTMTQTFTPIGGLTVGDILEARGRIEVIGGAASISGIGIFLDPNLSGVAPRWDGYGYVSDDLAAEGYSGTFRTPPYTVATSSNPTIGLWIFLKNDAAAARGLTLKISSLAAGKI